MTKYLWAQSNKWQANLVVFTACVKSKFRNHTWRVSRCLMAFQARARRPAATPSCPTFLEHIAILKYNDGSRRSVKNISCFCSNKFNAFWNFVAPFFQFFRSEKLNNKLEKRQNIVKCFHQNVGWKYLMRRDFEVDAFFVSKKHKNFTHRLGFPNGLQQFLMSFGLFPFCRVDVSEIAEFVDKSKTHLCI